MVQFTVLWRITKETHWFLLDRRSVRLRTGALPELRASLLRIRIRRLHIYPPAVTSLPCVPPAVTSLPCVPPAVALPPCVLSAVASPLCMLSPKSSRTEKNICLFRVRRPEIITPFESM